MPDTDHREEERRMGLNSYNSDPTFDPTRQDRDQIDMKDMKENKLTSKNARAMN